MTRRLRLAVTGVALIAPLLFVAYVIASGPATIRISIDRSAFSTTSITVAVGQPVTLVIENRDFIDHEWIVGDDAVHAAHRTGSEPLHGTRATEVSIPALETARTTITFAERGTFAFICHLPGHEGYGMRGIVIVD
ncbi:MAG: cupredoxin domain-containing protein [Chloroflexi bacterium]|nr:cupredoxin domain-containing protein [Chloroflexota bacterium]